MSMSALRRRRRRGSRGGSSLAGDPLDLFLDAITNALGVIMFILLMVVLFRRSPEAAKAPDRTAELAAAEQAVRELAAELGALPPAGDPEIARRMERASARVESSSKEVSRLLEDDARLRTSVSAAAAQLLEARRQVDASNARIAAAADGAGSPSLVRVGRRVRDARPAIHLAVSGGKVSAFEIDSSLHEVAAPADGVPVRDEASAFAAAKDLVKGRDPARSRVEIAAWQGSFREVKLLEKALADLGFDTGSMPIEAGQPIKVRKGAGEVQR